MILSDRDIKARLARGDLSVAPLENPEVQIQPANVDLRLGNRFRVFRISSTPFIDTRDSVKKEYTEELIVSDNERFIVHPGEFILASVKEYIKLPADLMGAVDGRSSLGRVGLVVHSTSATINPGWEGELVLEMTNIGKMPVAIYPNQRIAKLVLHQLSSPAERPYQSHAEAKYKGGQKFGEGKMQEEK